MEHWITNLKEKPYGIWKVIRNNKRRGEISSLPYCETSYSSQVADLFNEAFAAIFSPPTLPNFSDAITLTGSLWNIAVSTELKKNFIRKTEEQKSSWNWLLDTASSQSRSWCHHRAPTSHLARMHCQSVNTKYPRDWRQRMLYPFHRSKTQQFMTSSRSHFCLFLRLFLNPWYYQQWKHLLCTIMALTSMVFDLTPPLFFAHITIFMTSSLATSTMSKLSVFSWLPSMSKKPSIRCPTKLFSRLFQSAVYLALSSGVCIVTWKTEKKWLPLSGCPAHPQTV